MEVRVVSREMIKPSSPTIQTEEPYKLCLFDQLTPITYMSIVLFYPKISNNDTSKTLTHLKKSLSQTLDMYYPFSGRTKDNLFVEGFDAGVLFWEAEVDIRMSEYFELKDVESLNRLVPFKPLRKEAGSADVPLLAFQANVFSCGAMALGTSFCHKVADGETMSYFLSSWATLTRGKPDDVTNPSLSAAAAMFCPLGDFSELQRASVEQVWFHKEGNYVSRRFVFDAESIETLIEKAYNKQTSRHCCVPCR